MTREKDGLVPHGFKKKMVKFSNMIRSYTQIGVFPS